MKNHVRWEVEWQELTDAGKIRHLDADYEHDRDRDEHNLFAVYPTREQARQRARSLVRRGQTFYGVATIQEQHYLPIEGTVHFDWEPVGALEHIED